MALKELAVHRERGTCCELPAIDSEWAEQTASLMKALADPTRLTMVATLWKAAQPVCVCDFTECLPMEQPTVSHHLRWLREAELVRCERRGTWVYYRLAPGVHARLRRAVNSLFSLKTKAA